MGIVAFAFSLVWDDFFRSSSLSKINKWLLRMRLIFNICKLMSSSEQGMTGVNLDSSIKIIARLDWKKCSNCFTITAEILACSLAKFYCQYGDRHMNLLFMPCFNERERSTWKFAIAQTNWRQVSMPLSCYGQWVSSYRLVDPSYLVENVMTKSMINNRTDVWKTDVNLLI